MTIPNATRTTAFMAGVALSVVVVLLSMLKAWGVISQDADSPAGFPFVAIFFLITVFVFVIDVRSLAPKELKTKFPGLYFPTDRAGVNFLLRVWGRMLVWFLGVATGGGLLSLLRWGLK
jgi:hypothetical protein